MYLAKNEDFVEDITFSRRELCDILACVHSCLEIISMCTFKKNVEEKKAERDLIFLENKIERYLEGE